MIAAWAVSGCNDPSEEISECAEPDVDAEVLACSAYTQGLVVAHDSVWWIAGVTGVLDSMSPPPAVFSVDPDGWRAIEHYGLTHTPTHIDIDGALAFSTTDAVYVQRGGALDVIDPRGANGLRVVDMTVFWSSTEDGFIWRSDGDEATIAVEADHPIGLFDVAGDTFAWSRWDGPALHSSLQAEPIATAATTVQDLAILGERVVWVDIEAGIHATPLTGGATELLTADTLVTSFAFADPYLYYGRGFDRGELRRIPLAGGTPELLLEYPAQTGVIDHVAISGDSVYWSDSRIMRRRLE
jgi:hypothetical protein